MTLPPLYQIDILKGKNKYEHVKGKSILDSLYYYKSNKKKKMKQNSINLSGCRSKHREYGLYGFLVYPERLGDKGTSEQLLAKDSRTGSLNLTVEETGYLF